MPALLDRQRKSFHAALLRGVLTQSKAGVPSNADKHSAPSVRIAQGILRRLGGTSTSKRLAAQTSGNSFEEICTAFLKNTFVELGHLRPGTWEVTRSVTGGRLGIATFQQYAHLAALDALAKKDIDLKAALGSDYLIKPDLVVMRRPEPDAVINLPKPIVTGASAKNSSLRQSFNPDPLLHASISCKWTIRSDRSQNSRTEALNLIRNRKGRVPHIVVITGEPTPNRISSIALGTGDIDCVYHFALYELVAALEELNDESALELVQMMIAGGRLKDVSDLPLDLAV